MSLLEAFFLEFDSNADEIEKGSKKAEQATDKLEKKLKETDGAAGRLGLSLTRISRSLMGAVFSSIGIGTIVSGIKSAISYANDLAKASDSLGISVQQLDMWGSAVEKNGGTAQGFIQTVKSITASLGEVDKNGFRPAAEEWNRWGIRVTDAQGRLKNVLELLPQLASVFERMSSAKSYSLGHKLGLDDATIGMLQKGRVEVDAFIKRQKELGVVTKEDAELAAKFNAQWQDTTHAFRSVFVLAGSTILPVITAISKAFEKMAIFFRKHSDFILGALVGLAGALLHIVTPAVLATLASFAPFILIGGIFALLYDDIANFLKGNDSLLGQIIEKYPVVGEVLRSIGEGFKIFKKEFMESVDAWGKILGGLAFEIQSAWGSTFKFIMDTIDAITKAFNSIKDFFGFGGGDTKISATLQTAQQALQTASTSPIATQTSATLSTLNRSSARTTNVQTGPVTINTQATDANEIAAHFNKSLEEQLRDATADYDDGLLA